MFSIHQICFIWQQYTYPFCPVKCCFYVHTVISLFPICYIKSDTTILVLSRLAMIYRALNILVEILVFSFENAKHFQSDLVSFYEMGQNVTVCVCYYIHCLMATLKG